MSRTKFVTLTLNPAIDRCGKVQCLVPGEKLRCTDERTDPGGGGINVARVLKRYGADPIAVFPVGGLTGELLRRMVRAEDVSFEAIETPGETRENFSIQDLATAQQYRFVFPGPALAMADLRRCCDTALGHVVSGCHFVASGSLPPGAPADTYAQLAARVVAKGGLFVLDTSGEALRHTLGANVAIAKVNQAELQDITGKVTATREACIAASSAVLSRGVKMLAVTRGKEGALLITNEAAWEAAAPPVEVASTVGAGDSFFAVLIEALSRREEPPAALQAAVAAGSAALQVEVTRLAWPKPAERLMRQVNICNLTGVVDPVA
jgi:6-phosphofructokinase 2